MEADQNNSEFDYTIDLQTPFKTKLNRRSSIFRQQSEDVQNDNQTNSEQFSADYLNKLAEEITEWKKEYIKIKHMYQELKCQNDENIPEQEILEQLKDYPKRAEQFCTSVNNVVNMHKCLLHYKSVRMRQIQTINQITNTQIRNKLNFC